MRHHLLAAIFLICSVTYSNATKVALLDPLTGEEGNVTSFEKSLLRGELRKAIYRVEGWEAVSRSDIDQVLNELDFQHMGYVPKNEIHYLGQISGADYLCVSSLSKSDAQFYIEAYLVDVSTGNIDSPVSQLGEVKNGNMQNLYEVCQALIKDLIGDKVVSGGDLLEETFDNSKWGWTTFTYEAKSVLIANDELRITNYASRGITQSDVMVPIDVRKNFQITFQFLIQEAKMFTSVGIKFAGNKTFTVNAGTCSYASGKEVKTSGAAKMGLGRNRPVLISMTKSGDHITLQMNGITVFEEECVITTNQMSVFAGINTLAMLKKVSVQYIR